MKRENNCSGPKLLSIARGATTILLATILTLLTSCEDYPKDVKHTLDSVQSGVLRVGLVENPPWVIRGADGPQGLEPEMIRKLATQLDAEVRWHWGSTAIVIQALEQHQVQLAAGGFITGPQLPSTVAATKPYYTTRHTIGFLPNEQEPARVKGLTVALPFLSPLHKPLKEKGAELQTLAAPETSGLPLAGPSWWLKAHGYVPGRWTLLEQQQVMVVAKGENAWMRTVQRYLNGLADLDDKLQQWEAEQ